MAKIYLASSWRNPYQPSVLKALRDAGHEVYDFRNPPHGEGGFKWKNVDEQWEDWTNEDYIKSLTHPVAEFGFKNDMDAMLWADICVLLLPCGKSAHSEAGWMQGAGKPTYVLLTDKQEPELMYKLFAGVFSDVDSLLLALSRPRRILKLRKPLDCGTPKRKDGKVPKGVSKDVMWRFLLDENEGGMTNNQ